MTTFGDYLHHMMQTRMEPAGGGYTLPPPIPWGIDQAMNQTDNLVNDWWQGGALSPYLPSWVPNSYGPRPMDPHPVVVPNEFVGDEDWIIRALGGRYRGL